MIEKNKITFNLRSSHDVFKAANGKLYVFDTQPITTQTQTKDIIKELDESGHVVRQIEWSYGGQFVPNVTGTIFDIQSFDNRGSIPTTAITKIDSDGTVHKDWVTLENARDLFIVDHNDNIYFAYGWTISSKYPSYEIIKVASDGTITKSALPTEGEPMQWVVNAQGSVFLTLGSGTKSSTPNKGFGIYRYDQDLSHPTKVFDSPGGAEAQSGRLMFNGKDQPVIFVGPVEEPWPSEAPYQYFIDRCSIK